MSVYRPRALIWAILASPSMPVFGADEVAAAKRRAGADLLKAGKNADAIGLLADEAVAHKLAARANSERIARRRRLLTMTTVAALPIKGKFAKFAFRLTSTTRICPISSQEHPVSPFASISVAR
jgi:hypothetical protein